MSSRVLRLVPLSVLAVAFLAVGPVVTPDHASANGTHCTIYQNHVFDGALSNEYTTDLQGAQAYIGGFNTPTICNPTTSGTPSASSAWAMFAATNCNDGFAQSGAAHSNVYPNGQAADPSKVYIFAEQVSCDGSSNLFKFVISPNASATYCYTAAHSKGLAEDYFHVGPTCNSSTDYLAYSVPDDGYYTKIKDWAGDQAQYLGEIFDYYPPDGNGGESLDTSDSTCGASGTNGCNFTSLQLRNGSGVWFNSTGSTGTFSTGGTGHCGLGLIAHSKTSYTIWTSYALC